jgi:hypothetical protein
MERLAREKEQAMVTVSDISIRRMQDKAQHQAETACQC